MSVSQSDGDIMWIRNWPVMYVSFQINLELRTPFSKRIS